LIDFEGSRFRALAFVLLLARFLALVRFRSRSAFLFSFRFSRFVHSLSREKIYKELKTKNETSTRRKRENEKLETKRTLKANFETTARAYGVTVG
jgi:hypothetical protein